MNEAHASAIIARLDVMVSLLELIDQRLKMLYETVDRIDDSVRQTEKNTR